MKNHQFIGSNMDFIGFSVSLLCAVHCIALPIFLSIVPLTGLQFLDHIWIEYSIILASFIIASYALIHGYYKHHQKPLAMTVVVVGFILIVTGHFLQDEWKEIMLTSSGGVVIAIAHLLNWKHIKQANTMFPECLDQDKSK
ncbi:MerC domain-containing protein [Limibacter armeniacum]|uniref:MerC domain-containing protein n=1 Tax=Limibacter armeniacum TaxID=466084 RepID=UPI002FE61E0C